MSIYIKLGPVTKLDKRNKSASNYLTRRHAGKLWVYCHFFSLWLIWSNLEVGFLTYNL